MATKKELQKKQLERMRESAKKMDTRKAQEVFSNRVTVVLSVHYERRGEQPQSVGPIPYSQLLTETSLDMYSRKLKIPNKPTPIDFSWYNPKDVGFIIIQNMAGKGTLINPTQEERDRFSSQVLRVFYKGQPKGWKVYPWGGPFMFSPEDAASVMLASTTEDEIPIMLYAIPK